ncbi:hypothetical protein [uncultured Chryseobacterium sp.]|uniref:hypothetical protein n=1 Tax=uncultured Chryseobacterium sp. TaxID=259322 RepID=UPI0037490F30
MPYLEESIFTDTSKINFEEIENFKEIIPEGLNKANFNALEVVISVFNDADIGLFEKTIIEYQDDQNYK